MIYTVELFEKSKIMIITWSTEIHLLQQFKQGVVLFPEFFSPCEGVACGLLSIFVKLL